MSALVTTGFGHGSEDALNRIRDSRQHCLVGSSDHLGDIGALAVQDDPTFGDGLTSVNVDLGLPDASQL